jgi:hypothetical protein
MIVVSTVLANIPFPCRRSSLRFHLSAILFRLLVSSTGVTLLSLDVTRRFLGSCSSTWHGGGDRQA